MTRTGSWKAPSDRSADWNCRRSSSVRVCACTSLCLCACACVFCEVARNRKTNDVTNDGTCVSRVCLCVCAHSFIDVCFWLKTCSFGFCFCFCFFKYYFHTSFFFSTVFSFSFGFSTSFSGFPARLSWWRREEETGLVSSRRVLESSRRPSGST